MAAWGRRPTGPPQPTERGGRAASHNAQGPLPWPWTGHGAFQASLARLEHAGTAAPGCQARAPADCALDSVRWAAVIRQTASTGLWVV